MASKNETVAIKIEVSGEKDAERAFKSLSGSTDNMTGSFLKAGIQLEAIKSTLNVVSNVIKATAKTTVEFASSSVSAFREYEQSMTSLRIIAPKFGVAFEDAQKAAQTLGEELRIGTAPAVEALQVLLSDGLNLEQSHRS